MTKYNKKQKSKKIGKFRKLRNKRKVKRASKINHRKADKAFAAKVKTALHVEKKFYIIG